MSDESRMVFDIPVNFAEEGTVFGGKLKSRNAAETILLLILLLQPVISLRIGTKMKIYLAVLFVLPVCIFSIIGIQGESLSSFLMGVIYFFRTRKVWGIPDESYRMERVWKEQRKVKKAVKESNFSNNRFLEKQTERFRSNGGNGNGFFKKTGEKCKRKRGTKTGRKADAQGKRQPGEKNRSSTEEKNNAGEKG